MFDWLATTGSSPLRTAVPVHGIAFFGTDYSVTTIVLGTGIVILSVTLLVMMLSRWGEARPVAKCVVLSIMAHLLLVIYAYSTNMLQPAGPPKAEAIAVRMITDEPVDTSQERDWDQADSNFVPDTMHDDSPDPSEFSSDVPAESALDDSAEQIADSIPLPAEAWDPLEVSDPMEPFDQMAESPVEPDAIDDPANIDPWADSDFPAVDETASNLDPPAVETIEPSRTATDSATPNLTTDSDVARTLATDPEPVDEADAISSNRDSLIAQSHPAPTPATHASQSAVPHRTPKMQTPIRPATNSKRLPNKYKARTVERSQQASEQGGGDETETAVNEALAWLASVQSSDGRWDASAHSAGKHLPPNDNRSRNNSGAKADTAITSLALLAFLGAGHTHQDGPYKQNVRFGLEFLLKTSRRSGNGSLAGEATSHARMYCHGISTLALSEAFIMTQDRRLLPFLKNAVRYTLRSQNLTTGGWRYRPGDQGDTSQFGWQLMSLMSAKTAGLDVPDHRIRLMHVWLDRVSSGQNNELAAYTPWRAPSKTMTAEALVCRLFLEGPKDHRAIDGAASYVAREGIGSGQLNLYYCYYGTLGLYQMQDERWSSWNRELKAKILPRQRTDGPLSGSWDPDTVWGRNGGRVYTTALATLCLETYYRYLPFYDLPQDRTARLNALRR